MTEISIQQALETGLQLHQAGRLNEAEQIYRQVLSQQPQNSDALHLLGNIATSVGQPQIAINLIQRAIENAPGVSLYYISFGQALAMAGDSENSFQAYLRAVELDPTGENYARASRARGMSSPFVAIDLMKKAIDSGPATWDMYLTLGAMQWLTYQIDDAYTIFKRGLEVYPGNILIHSNLLHTMEHVYPV